MQKINVVVNCTNRKKVPAPEALQLRSIPQVAAARRVELWMRRLAEHDAPSVPVLDLYAGDHWHVARTIVTEALVHGRDARLWVCSAGHGLLHDRARVKPYSATFTPGQPDSITSVGASVARSELRHWWAGIIASRTGPEPRSLQELADREPSTPLLIVASQPYLEAMSDDLSAAVEALASRDLLSILSIGVLPSRLRKLGPHLLEADARLETEVGGTRSALNVRVARSLLRAADGKAEVTTSDLALILRRMAHGLPPPRVHDRRKMTDDEVRAYVIQARRDDPRVSKTQLLRALRESGAACEQVRFGALFAELTRTAGHE